MYVFRSLVASLLVVSIQDFTLVEVSYIAAELGRVRGKGRSLKEDRMVRTVKSFRD